MTAPFDDRPSGPDSPRKRVRQNSDGIPMEFRLPESSKVARILRVVKTEQAARMLDRHSPEDEE